jgi:beta-phosphoglucomutase
MIDSIIFDMDGVLWDSFQAHKRAYESIFIKYEVKFPGYEMFAGMKTKEVFEQQFPFSLVDKIGSERLAEEKTKIASELLKSSVVVNEKTIDAINRLRNRFKLGLATSSSSRNVDIFLKKSGLRSSFKTILTGDHVRKAKPDPEIFLTAAQFLGSYPPNCIVVEDSVSGIRAGQNAGMKVIAIQGTHSQDILIQLKPDWLIDGIHHIEDVI